MFSKKKTLAATVAAMAIVAPSIAMAANNTRPIEGVISHPQPVQAQSYYTGAQATEGYATSTRPVEHVIASPEPTSGVAFSRGGRMEVDESLSNSTRPYEGVISHPQPIRGTMTY